LRHEIRHGQDYSAAIRQRQAVGEFDLYVQERNAVANVSRETHSPIKNENLPYTRFGKQRNKAFVMAIFEQNFYPLQGKAWGMANFCRRYVSRETYAADGRHYRALNSFTSSGQDADLASQGCHGGIYLFAVKPTPVETLLSRALGADPGLKAEVLGGHFEMGCKPLPNHLGPTCLKACR
jgi:hypothetical protein